MRYSTARILVWAILASVVTLEACDGCGNGGSGDGGSAPAARPEESVPVPLADASAEVITPDSTTNPEVTIDYTLESSESSVAARFEYRLDGGDSWMTATLAPPYETTGLPAGPGGTKSSAVWLAQRDVPNNAEQTVRFRITPTIEGIDGTPGITEDFTVCHWNTKPSIVPAFFILDEVTRSVPLQTVERFPYWLVDAESHPCKVHEMSFSVDRGSTFYPASAGLGGSGTTNLISGVSASDVSAPNYHVLVWDYYRDFKLFGISSADRVVLRLTVSDGLISDPIDFELEGPYDVTGLTSGGSLLKPAFEDYTGRYWEDFDYHAMAFDGESSYLAGSDPRHSKWYFERYELSNGTFHWSSEIGAGPSGRVLNVVLSEYSFFLLGLEESLEGENRVLRWRIEKRSKRNGAVQKVRIVEPPVATISSVDPEFYTLALNHVHLNLDAQYLRIAGTEWNETAGRFGTRMMKLNPYDLSSVESFGTGGMIRVAETGEGSSPLMHEVRGSIVRGDQWILIGNRKLSEHEFDGQIEIRSKADGSLRTVWNLQQRVASIGGDLKEGILYLLMLVQESNQQARWRIEKRLLDDGTLLGARESVTTRNGHGKSQALIEGEFLYCMGTFTNEFGATAWRVEKRGLDLELIPGFGVGGAANLHPSSDSRALAMAFQQGALFVMGYETQPGATPEYVLEALLP